MNLSIPSFTFHDHLVDSEINFQLIQELKFVRKFIIYRENEDLAHIINISYWLAGHLLFDQKNFAKAMSGIDEYVNCQLNDLAVLLICTETLFKLLPTQNDLFAQRNIEILSQNVEKLIAATDIDEFANFRDRLKNNLITSYTLSVQKVKELCADSSIDFRSLHLLKWDELTQGYNTDEIWKCIQNLAFSYSRRLAILNAIEKACEAEIPAKGKSLPDSETFGRFRNKLNRQYAVHWYTPDDNDKSYDELKKEIEELKQTIIRQQTEIEYLKCNRPEGHTMTEERDSKKSMAFEQLKTMIPDEKMRNSLLHKTQTVSCSHNFAQLVVVPLLDQKLVDKKTVTTEKFIKMFIPFMVNNQNSLTPKNIRKHIHKVIDKM